MKRNLNITFLRKLRISYLFYKIFACFLGILSLGMQVFRDHLTDNEAPGGGLF